MNNLKIKKNILNEKSDILFDYFNDIKEFNILTPDEEKDLAVKAKNGDENARNKLIQANLRFVITCAKKYVNQGVSLSDLISAGNVGLVLALDNFQPERGFRFLSFAVWYIRREILKEIYNHGRTVRYPITFISKISKIKKVYDKFVNENDREPSDDEMINLSELTEDQYRSVNLGKSYCQSLDTPIYEDLTLKDIIESDYNGPNFTKDALLNAISHLNSREKKVIIEYFGIGVPEKSLQDLSEEMGLGQERIRQIKKKGLKKLEKFEHILKPLMNE